MKLPLLRKLGQALSKQADQLMDLIENQAVKEEAQRRLRQREAQLRAPKAERSSEEAGEHLFGIYVVRAPINACRERRRGGSTLALQMLAICGTMQSRRCKRSDVEVCYANSRCA